MIYVCIREEEKEGRLYLQLKGHAEGGKEGQDLICAAASVLTYTAAQFFSYLHGEGKLREAPELRLQKGDSLLCACPREAYYEEALHGIYVLCLGFELLTRQYPQNLHLRAFGQNCTSGRGS